MLMYPKTKIPSYNGHIAPIKFTPLYKRKLWGGDKILPFKGLPATQDHIGESWEISGVKGDETTVDGGPFDGMAVSELTNQLKDRLVGKRNYEAFGNEFPILVKFIDASKDLSVQVHPNDAMAQRHGFPNGKTEMWYVVSTNHKAHIICGFEKSLSPAEYKKAVEDNTLLGMLQDHEAHTGDCFFIPAGRVHSIGSGTFLIEIQQTSDLTYRIYDYNRRDENGKLRELHTDLAAEAINFKVESNYRTQYASQTDAPVQLIDSNVFKTRIYSLTKEYDADYSATDSFVIYVAFAGSAALTDEWGNSASLRKGESILIPAETDKIKITPQEENFKFLETYL